MPRILISKHNFIKADGEYDHILGEEIDVLCPPFDPLVPVLLLVQLRFLLLVQLSVLLLRCCEILYVGG